MGQFGKIAIQAVYFIVLARALGPSEYGIFAAIAAIAAMTGPFSSLGTSTLLVRNVSRDKESAASQWTLVLLVSTVTGLFLVMVLVLLVPALAPTGTSIQVALAILVADILAGRLVETAGMVAQAQERMGRLALYPVLLNLLRLAAITSLIVYFDDDFTLTQWAWLYAAASISMAIFAVTEVSINTGIAKPDLARYRREWKDGLYFSIGLSAQSAYNDIDKTMLGRINSAEATGVYSAGFRIVDMAYTPIRAMAAASFPRFFKVGARGQREMLKFVKRLAAPAIGYTLLAGVGLLSLAHVVPLLLGQEYGEAVYVIQLLAPLPLLKALTFLAADALAGLNRHRARSTSQVTLAFVNIGLNLVLLPKYGVTGAVASTLITEIILATLLWFFLLRRR